MAGRHSIKSQKGIQKISLKVFGFIGVELKENLFFLWKLIEEVGKSVWCGKEVVGIGRNCCIVPP